MNSAGREEERKQVRRGESGGVLGSADRGRAAGRGSATAAAACCDKHWLKSLSRSDTAATFERVCVTFDSPNPYWSPTQIQN